MNEARNNPNAQAKAEGIKSGFRTEINDIAIIVKLAEIGLEGLKMVDLSNDNGENAQMVKTLLSVGPGVISKFTETAKFLYEKAQSQTQAER